MQYDDHPTDLLPAYALGSLDPEELAQVEAHLANCSACQAEVASYSAVAGRLAWGTPEVEVPEGLRQRVLERARQPGNNLTLGRHTNEGLLTRLRRLLMAPWWRPVVAGLVLLLLLSNFYFLQRLRQVESQLAAVQAASLATIHLKGTEAAPDARGVIVIGRDGRTASLVVDGLPALGPEQQYQLWLVQGEERDSGAVFSVDEAGYTITPIQATQALLTYTRFGVTIEPAGGSPGPTGEGVLRLAGVEN